MFFFILVVVGMMIFFFIFIICIGGSLMFIVSLSWFGRFGFFKMRRFIVICI